MSKSDVSHLPDEIWGKIITDHLKKDDVCSMNSVCKDMHSAVEGWLRDDAMQIAWLVDNYSTAAFRYSFGKTDTVGAIVPLLHQCDVPLL